MRLLHWCLALALLVGFTVSAEAAKGKKGKKGAGLVNGVITAITKDAGKGTGTITVEVRQHKKKGETSAPPAVEKTFQINSATKFTVIQKVKGQKGQGEQTAGTFASIEKGNHVTIQATGDAAEEVKLLLGGKKKK